MKQKVYVTRLIPEIGINMLKHHFDVKVWGEELPPPRDILLKEVEEVDGLVSLLTDKIDGELLDYGKNLKIVSNYAVGFDNINVNEATDRGVITTNTPGVLTDTTADLAFTLLMSTARRIVESVNFVKKGNWKTWGPKLLLGQDIYGATLGLIGLGRIGYAVAKRAKGFDMDLQYYDVFRNEAAEKGLGIKYVELDELIINSDFISIHVPLTPETKHLINKDSLKKMKNSAILVNTARGPIVDEKALYEAIVNGEIAGAGLDVTDPEPMELDNPLLTLDNVIVVPHIASASYVTRNKMAEMAAQNIIAGLKGECPPNILNKEVMNKLRK
jgi:glyoxylate reductase